MNGLTDIQCLTKQLASNQAACNGIKPALENQSSGQAGNNNLAFVSDGKSLTITDSQHDRFILNYREIGQIERFVSQG